MADIMSSVQVVYIEPGKMPSKEEASGGPHLKCGPHTNTQVADFNFKQRSGASSLQASSGNIPLENENQAKFIDLIYINQEVFSLHDDDLGYCDQFTHTILTSTNKPVFLLHRTVLR